jgi:hypothetical protein
MSFGVLGRGRGFGATVVVVPVVVSAVVVPLVSVVPVDVPVVPVGLVPVPSSAPATGTRARSPAHARPAAPQAKKAAIFAPRLTMSV